MMGKSNMKALLTLALLCLPAPLLAQTPAAADTPGRTAGGVSYTQPRDWLISTRGPATLFAAPEGNLNIAVVEVGSAADAAAAAAKAWAA